MINVSSGSGLVSAPLMGPYCASKFARAVRRPAAELRGFGIDVVLIEPGGMRTPLVDKEQPQIRRMRTNSRLTRRRSKRSSRRRSDVVRAWIGRGRNRYPALSPATLRRRFQYRSSRLLRQTALIEPS